MTHIPLMIMMLYQFCLNYQTKEGLSLCTSTGINVAGAIKLAKDLGPSPTIVTILCDKSEIYRCKLFNMIFHN